MNVNFCHYEEGKVMFVIERGRKGSSSRPGLLTFICDILFYGCLISPDIGYLISFLISLKSNEYL